MEVNIDELLKMESNTCRSHFVQKTILHNECGGACCFCSNKLPMSLYIYSIEHQSIMAALQTYIYSIFSRVCVRYLYIFAYHFM